VYVVVYPISRLSLVCSNQLQIEAERCDRN
jgi:hypothetical protein